MKWNIVSDAKYFDELDRNYPKEEVIAQQQALLPCENVGILHILPFINKTRKMANMEFDMKCDYFYNKTAL